MIAPLKFVTIINKIEQIDNVNIKNWVLIFEFPLSEKETITIVIILKLSWE